MRRVALVGLVALVGGFALSQFAGASAWASQSVPRAPALGGGRGAIQFYGDEGLLATPDPLTATAGSTMWGVNTGSASGAISGTVTDAVTQSGLPGAWVGVYPNGSRVRLALVQTAADGSYVVSGLAAGSYRVSFADGPGYASQYYNDKASLLTAGLVSVAASATTAGIDAALLPAGQIAGAVTGALTDAALGGVRVRLYDPGHNLVAATTTAADGTYTFARVGGGTYEVGFAATGNYLAQFYSDKGSLASADPVTVTAGSTTSGIDAAMASGAITGTVTDAATHAALAGASVGVFLNGSRIALVQTAADGSYAVSDLATGSYKVAFADGPGYASEYYNGRSSLDTADPLPVTAGATTAAIDAALQPAGQIAGTVTEASTRAALGGVPVRLYDQTDQSLALTTTAADGTYSFARVAAGIYKVGFAAVGVYAAQFYSGKGSLASADPVTVTAGSTTSGIDAAMVSGAITGVVTDAPTHAALAGASVGVFLNGSRIALVQTAADGSYAVSDLATGSYKVAFADGPGYASEYYNGRRSLDTADPVRVTAGATTAAIDAALQPAGQITGAVTDALTNAALGGVRVRLYDPSHNLVAATTTAADGTYTFARVAGGTYDVAFAATGNYLAQFYSDKSSLASADPVTVTAGSTTSGIDAAMASGAITGTVIDALSHSPLPGASVCVYVNGSQARQVQTAADGSYVVSGLATGTYEVAFANGASYSPQFYNNKPTLATADPVAVTAGATTAANAALQPAGQITGTVTDAVTGDTMTLVTVTLYDRSHNPVAVTTTPFDGTYTLGSIPPGTYEVGFAKDVTESRYLPQFYNSESLLASADPITVTAFGNTSGIDAAMASGAITGTVNIAGAMVTVYDGTQVVGVAQTASDGSYAIPGLATGTYKVKFREDFNGRFLSQFYYGQRAAASANPVSVTAGATTAGIDGFGGGLWAATPRRTGWRRHPDRATAADIETKSDHSPPPPTTHAADTTGFVARPTLR